MRIAPKVRVIAVAACRHKEMAAMRRHLFVTTDLERDLPKIP